MEVICLESEALYTLIEAVVRRMEKAAPAQEPEKWISGKEAMSLLNIKSKTTLQNLRDEGRIRFSQPKRKVILYDRASIMNYLETCVRETF